MVQSSEIKMLITWPVTKRKLLHISSFILFLPTETGSVVIIHYIILICGKTTGKEIFAPIWH